MFDYFMHCITSVETYLASSHAGMSVDDEGFDTSVIKSLQLSLYQWAGRLKLTIFPHSPTENEVTKTCLLKVTGACISLVALH